tara:strand:+ start:844 stop:1065 length:222 start_codon:yes stop_codon:yes gene_type:complete
MLSNPLYEITHTAKQFSCAVHRREDVPVIGIFYLCSCPNLALDTDLIPIAAFKPLDAFNDSLDKTFTITTKVV